MDRSILKQYLSGFQTVSRPSFFLENSMALGNLPQNINYNGLLYTYSLQENAFINQFGHKIDPSQAPAFVTEALAFTQQVPAAIMDLSSNAGDSRSRAVDTPPEVQNFIVFSAPEVTIANDLSWTFLSPFAIDSFIVKYSPTGPKGPFIDLAGITNTDVQFYTHTGVTPGATYYYKITTVKGTNLTDSEVITFQTAGSSFAGATGLTAPSGLTTFSITETTIGLTWQDNSVNEQGFFVYRAIGNSAQPFTLVRGTLANTNFTTLSKLTQGTTYSFKVAAYGTGATSAFSNTITVRTTPLSPSPGEIGL